MKKQGMNSYNFFYPKEPSPLLGIFKNKCSVYPTLNMNRKSLIEEKEEENKYKLNDINNKIKILIEKNESLTVEDLLKYINGNDNKKKKKKKRRKKKKIEENKNINNINIQIEEKDGVVENFKSYIIDSYENIDKNQKIKPNLSQAFLDKLIVLSN